MFPGTPVIPSPIGSLPARASESMVAERPFARNRRQDGKDTSALRRDPSYPFVVTRRRSG
jgi:hypothetical protein